MPLLSFFVLGLYGVCLLFIVSFSLVQWRLTHLALRAHAQALPPPPSPAGWPRVTVQLPLYNERNVAERIIDAAAALDYPPALLHIQVLDDSTDETVELVAARVARHAATGLHISHVRRPHRQGYKAGALAHGLGLTAGEFVAVFDADFIPEPDFLRQTIPHLSANPRTGVVQTRWGHLNAGESLLTRLQGFGLDAHFLIEQVGRQAGGHFINFNGTGGVWRRHCIDDAGGWRDDTLTEDLDLSYRAQLRGWHFAYLPAVVAPAELPAAMDALKSQQFRWNKGAAETARLHLGTVWRSGSRLGTKLHATFHLLNSSVYLAILLMAVLSVPLVFVKAEHPQWQLAFRLAAVFPLAFVPLVYFFLTAWRLGRAQRSDTGNYLGFFLLFLSVSMGLALHNAWAVAQGWLGRRSPFIRTPKTGGRASSSRYRSGGLNWQVALEGLLALYFVVGMAAGVYLHDLGLLPFHLLLAFGFATVCYYSIRHAR